MEQVGSDWVHFLGGEDLCFSFKTIDVKMVEPAKKSSEDVFICQDSVRVPRSDATSSARWICKCSKLWLKRLTN